MSPHKLVVAIDGPAASGKTTTARLVAEELGYMHIDTGAMYRAVTLKVLRSGARPEDETRAAALMRATRVQLKKKGGELRVLLDGEDVTGDIRSVAVTRAVSAVSSLRSVREAMVREQRRMGRSGGIVLEGRDIGTVVFPDADIKFFITAGIEVRARRRRNELLAQGVEASIDALREEIEERDRRDASRDVSPLKKAPDAIVVDTSGMTVEEQVEFVVSKVKERLRRES